ncbi:unnamed protein product [Dovyalis caffra]|uniref:Pentatricopeptide repeat-containing protein n=1 Tax=Dovyalis caffra TaxID=77055 RepID=A0AAV1QPU9_9ROSI|nr:unnamed protein product [Dovyalis caffra]
MAKLGFCPNLIVYNCLIDGQSSSGNLSEATQLFLEMEKFKISPDGFCGVGRTGEADVLLTRMNSEGVIADSVTYNSLINGYCKEGNMEKALEVYSQMTKSVKPDVITFSTLNDGYCKAGNVQSATSLYSEMVIKSIVPDRGHLTVKHLIGVMMLHADVIKMGIMPNDKGDGPSCIELPASALCQTGYG